MSQYVRNWLGHIKAKGQHHSFYTSLIKKTPKISGSFAISSSKTSMLKAICGGAGFHTYILYHRKYETIE